MSKRQIALVVTGSVTFMLAFPWVFLGLQHYYAWIGKFAP